MRLLDAAGQELAGAGHPTEALLRMNRTFQPGDVIEIVSDRKHL